ncbi:expressed unknown protein [Seminavis robusta]|uniref:Transmembrane protein n=1 Tax=Seminavis robusta TaxID=568900 RepID=A0A9N8EY32_9STRA|nr:expressed unknown protein [Seminavis robusta]|eukprot:Sro2232_g320091.1  (166) ;mRNA; f:8565-9062
MSNSFSDLEGNPSLASGASGEMRVGLLSTQQEEPKGNGNNVVCASFWIYASIVAHVTFMVLSTIGFFAVLLVADVPNVTRMAKLQAFGAFSFAQVLLLAVASLGIHGARKSNEHMVQIPMCVYGFFALLRLGSLDLNGFALFAVLTVPQVMLVREIRRGEAIHRG